MRVVAIIALVIIVIAGLFYWSKTGFNSAQSYCSNLVPILEEWKNRHGVYPESLKDIIAQGLEPPVSATGLGTEACSYKQFSNGTAFYLAISGGTGTSCVTSYSSETKNWSQSCI